MGSVRLPTCLRPLWLCLVTLSAPSLCVAQADSVQVGSLDFFGTAGIDVASIRAAMPLHPGDTIAPDDAAALKARVNTAVARLAGAPATDVSIVCCDASGRALIYIGLPGKNVRARSHLPPPAGSSCLPEVALRLYDRATDASQAAIQAGDTAEDHSNGYALSHHPAYRAAQLALREYAITHASLLRAALAGCARPGDRSAAAQLLGYANRSPAQIDALVRAANDSDRAVRNNAVRALWVLASGRSRAEIARIPAAPFIAMLNSATWEDRNKAGLLLSALATRRHSNTLADLRRNAMDSLVEMARWDDPGHAYAYRVLLGRLAGFDDVRVNELISTGKVETIIEAAQRR